MTDRSYENVEALADGRMNCNTWDEYHGLKAEVRALLDEVKSLRATRRELRAQLDDLLYWNDESGSDFP